MRETVVGDEARSADRVLLIMLGNMDPSGGIRATGGL